MIRIQTQKYGVIYKYKDISLNKIEYLLVKGVIFNKWGFPKGKKDENESDIECAKLYNQQALYFNNHFGTNYKLNDIENFTTVDKNYISSIKKKYSRFIGVSIRNDSDKFRAYIKYNGKRIDCGTFKNEEDAARAYNKKAEELNALETTKIKYMINEIS